MQPQPTTTLPESATVTRQRMDNAVRLPTQPPAFRRLSGGLPIRLAAALALTLPPMAASAQVGATSQTVTYADLDLTTSADRRELSRRIQAAARQVCGGVRYGTGVDRVARYRACVSDATRDAEARIQPDVRVRAFAVQVRPPARSRF